MSEWYAEWKKVEWTSKDKYKVGSTIHEIGEIAGIKGELDYEATEVIENEKLAWRTTGGSPTAIGFTALSPTKAGTKAIITFDYEMPYSYLGKLVDKLRVHKALEKSFEVGLKKLKDMMEK